jgi:GNAT superfamily N-acetyltransferase
MKIQRANPEDLDEIMELLYSCVQEMWKLGIFQWDGYYPRRNLITKDIETGVLFMMKDDERITGIIVVTDVEDKEYCDVDWTDKSGNSMIVHHLAVRTDLRNRGLGKKLMAFAEEHARGKDSSSIHLDTYSGNKRAEKFYESLGYERKPGHIHFSHRILPYYCFEKILD